MLVLITLEKNNDSEKEQLTQIFESGLSLLHVRKPEISEEELRSWLSGFEECCLRKMVLHQHHRLAASFPVKGIHLTEHLRSKNKELVQYIERYKLGGFTVSSSFHDPEKIKNEASLFDYSFLSPVFTSISKDGYEGQGFDVKNLPFKTIALGGIKAEKISKAKELGYDGVAILGAIWQSENKEGAFTEIFNEYNNVFQ
ncbi:thiamine phosphate synthase [uncultured Cyclobacterium sp.]|uniref:thiamine phosphate synthase n=1 Tax=uncultured Cyclobacterium sp. TaxID=453820 RepID=UPI0030EDB067|tara:strand:- start:156050 stop:156646 length:597 start_codon:yes stop_codon:yes gene_type:complete